MKTQEFNQENRAFQPSRQELSEFLREQPICTIATLAEDGRPQAATVAFSETEDGRFIIGTREVSRKAANIQRDPRVAMVITDTDKRYTVQLEGEAHALSANEFDALAEYHYQQLPASRPFKDQPGQIHIAITPDFIRFSDCSVYPWVLTEFPSDSI